MSRRKATVESSVLMQKFQANRFKLPITPSEFAFCHRVLNSVASFFLKQNRAPNSQEFTYFARSRNLAFKSNLSFMDV